MSDRAASHLNAGAATLAAAVLTDSAIEHYRGGFYRPAMYIAPIVSTLALIASATGGRQRAERHYVRGALFGAAAATGAVGSWFHLTNLSKRGGWRWLNVFYGAPAAAPLALHVAGLLGAAAEYVPIASRSDASSTALTRHAPAALGGLVAASLLGTSAETWVFHFRGAFQNPAMYVPVSLPPVAAAALGGAVLTRRHGWMRAARALLRVTALVGIAGVGFHAYGVHRRMGGWRNWTQNLLSGPPLPAPPAFTGLALAGLAVLHLIAAEARADGISHAVSRL